MKSKQRFFKETIKDVPLRGETVLVRVDYNIPLNQKGEISDDLRIRGSLPTIKYLLERGCKVVLISHLGRPDGKEAKYSLEQVGVRLSELLHQSVTFIGDTIGDEVYQTVRKAPKKSVLLLENLRFYSEEEADSAAFAKAIICSTRATYFVQDGFGVVHRAHASTHAIAMEIPSVAGLLLEREYQTITAAMKAPTRPLVAVMGGAKVSDKIGVIEHFVSVADTILIGGAMANTFLAYKGYGVGMSKIESDQTEVLDRLYAAAAKKVGQENVDSFIVLPTDVAVANEINAQAKRVVRSVADIKFDDIALDVGDESIERYTAIVANAKTVIWNGTLGYAELPEFAHGSARLALTLATTQPKITSIIGGGDTADFALKWDGSDGKSFSHVSTGGGASLDLMAGKKLPGIESLLDARP